MQRWRRVQRRGDVRDRRPDGNCGGGGGSPRLERGRTYRGRVKRYNPKGVNNFCIRWWRGFPRVAPLYYYSSSTPAARAPTFCFPSSSFLNIEYTHIIYINIEIIHWYSRTLQMNNSAIYYIIYNYIDVIIFKGVRFHQGCNVILKEMQICNILYILL